MRAAGDLLTRAGFALPVADSEAWSPLFRPSPRWSRTCAAWRATNLLAGATRRPFGRLGLPPRPPISPRTPIRTGKTAERFEIVHLSGWAPSPDQPKPARRGSGTASLADALEPKG